MESASSTLSLDQFVALNEELAMLSRAGVPMEQGLLDLGRDWRGRLGKVAEVLGSQLKSGRSLADALADPQFNFPPAYRAAIVAGLRSGRLAAAFEGVALTARRAAESRRLIGLAMIYPLLVIALAYGLATFFLVTLLPRFWDAYVAQMTAPSFIVQLLNRLQNSPVAMWLWVSLPIPLLLATWWIWWRSGQTATLQATGGVWRPSRWISPRQVRQWNRLAMFADLLALLIEHEVPAAEALDLAGDSAGDEHLAKAAKTLADRLRRGELLTRENAAHAAATLPPLLAWLIIAGQERVTWSRSLRQAALSYRERGQHALDWLSWYLPILLTAVIGGTVTIVYGLLVFWPFTSLLFDFAQPK